MILTTTNTLQGKNISDYKGIVSGETIIGANAIKDFFASVTDFFGGRSSSYEKVLIEAKEIAIEELKEKAQKLGANAIIGIDFDYETIGERGSMMMVTATGTAITIE
ncbi:MAG: YbjQ family protein [Flavobacteriales bacterium]